MTFVNRQEGAGEGSCVPRCLGILIALEAGTSLRSELDGGGTRKGLGGQDG